MAENLKHPVYRYKDSNECKPGEEMYACRQPKCCWNGNNLDTFLDHLKESHGINQREFFDVGVDQCCGQLLPSKLWAAEHFLNHALLYQNKAPKI